MTLIPIDLEWIQDPPRPAPVWSVDLCVGWERAAQLQGDAYVFDGTELDRASGQWTCSFPDGAGSWGSRKVPDLPNYLDWSSGFVAATDNAGLDVTGDIDVRWFGFFDDWSASNVALVAKWEAALSNNRSYLLRILNGQAQFFISTDGTTQAGTTAITYPFAPGEYGGIRMERIQSTGVTTTYFSSDGVTWTSAGTSTLSATSAIYNSTADVLLGGHSGGFLSRPTGGGTVWAQIRAGSTLVGSPDFSELPDGHHLFFSPAKDSQGNVWNGFGSDIHVTQHRDVVMTQWTPADIDTVRLIEDGRVRFAGAVLEPDDNGTGGCTSVKDADGGIRWTLSGPDLYGAVLTSRIAFPDPTVASGWSDASDDRTGVASTVISEYLSYNLGPDALTERQIEGLTVLDTVNGSTVSWSAYFERLDELVSSLCRATETTVRATVDSEGQIVLRVSSLRNLSASHVLADQAGDFSTLTVRRIPLRTSWVLSAGAGEGVTRAFAVSQTDEVGMARREAFVDASSAASSGQVASEASTVRQLAVEQWSVSAEVVDEPVAGWRFGRDVFVGDTIAVDDGRYRHPVPVTQVAWHVDAGRPSVRATLGDAAPNALVALKRRLARLEARTGSRTA